MVDLLPVVELSRIGLLNGTPESQPASVFESKGTVESDADQQLLFFVSFSQAVRVGSIVVDGPPDAGPRVVKLFANHPSIDFSDVDDLIPTAEVDLNVGDLGKEKSLDVTAFRQVQSLTIFIEENIEDTESTVVNHIGFKGTIPNSFNMKDFKACKS